MTQSTRDSRTLLQVVRHDLSNYVYFFLPLVIIHNVAWAIKPLVTDDARGPWEMLWHRFLDIANIKDRYFLYVYGTVIVTTAFYWLTAGLFLLMDYAQWPAFLVRYKIQPGKNAPPSTRKVIQVLLTVLFNQALGIPAGMLNYGTWSNRASADLKLVPNAIETFTTMFVCMLCHDFIFYHGHKLLHHRLLYKHIHKKHHEWQAPIAAAAEYAHPIEHIITGIISVNAGMFIMAAPIPVTWIWLCWIIFQVQNDHSGYHFPLLFSPEFHDYHHLKFHTSYGWLSFWDWFWGTDADFQKSKIYTKRNIRLFTAKSARELVPDEKTN